MTPKEAFRNWSQRNENLNQKKEFEVVSSKHAEIMEPCEYLEGDIYKWYPRLKGETKIEHETRVLERPREEKKLGKKEETTMREFSTGATRDSDDEKPDYEGFFSPLVFRRYGEYMHRHRKQADGNKRASDNWQKGIPLAAYMKSLWRHLVEFWTEHRYHYELSDALAEDNREELLCAIIFNASGYLHELIKEKNLEN